MIIESFRYRIPTLNLATAIDRASFFGSKIISDFQTIFEFKTLTQSFYDSSTYF